MDPFVGGGLNGIFLWFHQSFAGRFQVNLAAVLVLLTVILRLGFSIRHRTNPHFPSVRFADNIRS